MAIKFYTSYFGCPIVPEVNDEPSQVMLAGFEPDDLRIKELLLAGERLEAFKFGYSENLADYDFDSDEIVPDNYDVVDDYMDELEAQEIYNQTMQRIQASIEERENSFSRRLKEEKSSSVVEDNPEPTKEDA
jgi:hypothetical protein